MNIHKMKYLFSLFFLAATLPLLSQEIDGVSLDSIGTKYAIVSIQRAANSYYIVHMDYGQRDLITANKDTEIREGDRAIRFNSLAHVIIWLDERNWYFEKEVGGKMLFEKNKSRYD